MKRILFLAFVVAATSTAFAQKKKKPAAKKPAAVAACISKLDNLTAEVKSGNFQITIAAAGKGKAADAIIVKSSDPNSGPSDCKLTSFTASGTKLYLLQWTEKAQVISGKKTENKTTIFSTVYEIANKKQVFSNSQITNNITEIVSLGGTQATETQERIRREGFEFILGADGSITQKSKTQQNKWVYDVAKMEFVDAAKRK